MERENLNLFYITNNSDVALIVEKYGVNRIWVDIETIGKEKRQKGMNTVKSHHTIGDISNIKPKLTSAEMLVRINSWYDGSKNEVEEVIDAGADIIMLPYWKSIADVESFLKAVDGRCKTTLLLETKEAVDIVDDILKMDFDEIHIGINDLCISYGLTFMFELLANGCVEMLCKKFKNRGLPYGFGGIARLGDGLLPAEKIIMEHYRLGSTRAILSRTFCDTSKINSIEEIDAIFKLNMDRLRAYEKTLGDVSDEEFENNRKDVVTSVNQIVNGIKQKQGKD